MGQESVDIGWERADHRDLEMTDIGWERLVWAREGLI